MRSLRWIHHSHAARANPLWRLGEAARQEAERRVRRAEEAREAQPKVAFVRLTDIKTSPKKLTVACQLVKNRHVNDAIVLSQSHPKKALKFVHLALKEARARAVDEMGMDPSKLVVQRALVGKGTYLKRVLPHARGRAGRMVRYRAHLRVELAYGDATPRVRVLLPWLMRRRLLEERREGRMQEPVSEVDVVAAFATQAEAARAAHKRASPSGAGDGEAAPDAAKAGKGPGPKGNRRDEKRQNWTFKGVRV